MPIVIASNYVQLWVPYDPLSRWMPTTFADNLHKFNRGAISRAVPSPAECSNPETLSTTREQGEEDRTRCNVPLRRINGGSRGGEGKEGEKRYGNNGLFALGISYNPPFLPLPCCFLRPQFIIFPSFSLLFRFLSPPPVFDAAIEKRRMGRGGGIVAKVRYRCRRGDTGVARITYPAAPAGWKRPPSLQATLSDVSSGMQRHEPLFSLDSIERGRKFRRSEGLADASRINIEFVIHYSLRNFGKNLVVKLESKPG